MAAAWTPGLSETSIGRFGAYRSDSVPYNNGYLACSATATRVYLELDYDKGLELGWYQVPQDFRQNTEASWAGMTYTFRHGNGKPHSTVTRSLLFPGFHHRIHTGKFEYYWRIKGFGPTNMALPLAKGMTLRHPTAGYDRRTDGELARPWVLFWFAQDNMPFDYPMLFTFDKRPERIEVFSHEYLKIFFKDRNATVVQVHPFGAERLDKAVTVKWARRLPAAVVKTCDTWAAASLAYPYACKEEFRIDGRSDTCHIRNTFTYRKAQSAWGVKPLVLAPLPPGLANARNFGYPVHIKGRLMERMCPTFSGYYEAVEGGRLEYDIPLSRFREHTLAPVRIKGDRTAEMVQKKLEKYLASGNYMTFGGDDHYDPYCSLDALHDLRIMARAIWSIAPEKRKKVVGQLTRGLAGFGPQDFLEFTTPGTGLKSVRHKTIFDYLGVIDYDSEWYNGMNLAGLWAYDYFTEGDAALKFSRKHWPLIQKIFAYYQGYTDWSHLAAWTSARGEATWLDGINYAYEGLLGYAALARKLGKAADAGWGDYLAARTEIYMFNCWQTGAYYKAFFPGDNPGVPLCAAGWHEGRPTRTGDMSDWSCGNYSYAVHEAFLLMKDLGLEKDIAAAMKRFAKNFPKWRSDPYRSRNETYPGDDMRRTIHHYFLDPRLMACALVLREDVKNLLKVGEVLTAPVLETYLMSMAPLVLVPRSAAFRGTEWDARTRILTVRLKGTGKTSIGIAHSGRPKAVTPNGSKAVQKASGIFYDVELHGETEIIFKF